MAGANTPEPIVVTGSDGNEYVVGTWNHGTVADGVVLTEETIKPICDAIQGGSNGLSAEIERAKKAEQEISAVVDNHYDEYTTFVNNEYTPFKTSVIASAAALDKKIDDVSAESLRYDTFLSGQIDTLKAATDVIAVFGTYEEFTAASAGDWQQQVTDNDFVKVLNGKGGSKQVYYEWHDNTHTTTAPDWKGWSAIGELDPYYSKSEVDTWRNARFTETSANYALVAANAEKLGGTEANAIINSAKSGYNASAWLLANAKNYITTAEYSPYNPSYIDCTLSVTQIPNTSASKLTVQIKPIDSFIGSAESGKSAYDWITTKSATLSAGQYIKFTSAAENTMGITVTGILPYDDGNCIDVDNSTHKINLSAIVSANKYIAKELNDTSNQLSITKNKIELSGYTNNSISYSANYSTSAVHLYSRLPNPPGGAYGVDIKSDSVSLTSYPHMGESTITTASWYNILTNSYKNFVIASANQTIQVATASTIPEPSDMETGWIYLV